MVYVSTLNKLDNLYRIIIAMMEEEGRDFSTCELCKQPILNGNFELHHTKYEGATYYDLLIVCRRCNHLPENVNLK